MDFLAIFLKDKTLDDVKKTLLKIRASQDAGITFLWPPEKNEEEQQEAARDKASTDILDVEHLSIGTLEDND